MKPGESASYQIAFQEKSSKEDLKIRTHFFHVLLSLSTCWLAKHEDFFFCSCADVCHAIWVSNKRSLNDHSLGRTGYVADCRWMSSNVATYFHKIGILKEKSFFGPNFQNKQVIEMKKEEIIGGATIELRPVRPVSFHWFSSKILVLKIGGDTRRHSATFSDIRRHYQCRPTFSPLKAMELHSRKFLLRLQTSMDLSKKWEFQFFSEYSLKW